MFDIAHRNGERLLALINDLLIYPRSNQAKTTLYVEELTLDTFLADLKATITPLAEQNHNQLELIILSDLENIRTDVTKLRQILLNLLSNACKFTADGLISIKVSKPSQRDDVVLLYNRRQRARYDRTTV